MFKILNFNFTCALDLCLLIFFLKFRVLICNIFLGIQNIFIEELTVFRVSTTKMTEKCLGVD